VKESAVPYTGERATCVTGFLVAMLTLLGVAGVVVGVWVVVRSVHRIGPGSLVPIHAGPASTAWPRP
jgi:uncharacterized membrane protein